MVVRIFAWLLVVMVVVVCGAPQPDLVFKVNPTLHNDGTVFAPALVTSTQSAFLTYKYPNQTLEVAFVNPSKPELRYMERFQVDFPKTTDETFYQPIAISDTQALFYTTFEDASLVAIITPHGAKWKADRRGSSAEIEYTSDHGIVFVPYGAVPRYPDEDYIEAFDVRAADEDHMLLWSQSFELPNNTKDLSAIGTPEYDEDNLYLMQSNDLYKLNIYNGTTVFKLPDPCDIIPAQGEYLQMRKVFYGWDARTRMNAFVVFGNTTKDGKKTSSICRFSHRYGTQKWRVDQGGDWDFDSVTGGGDAIFVQASYGSVPDTHYMKYTVFVYNADTGHLLWSINRRYRDRFSTPIALDPEQSVTAEHAAFQVNGSLYGFDIRTGAILWVSQYACDTAAVFSAKHQIIICVDFEETVHAISAKDGSLVWMIPKVDSLYSPTIVDDYVFFTDSKATLFGYKLVAEPEKEKEKAVGLTILIVLLVCVVIVLIAAFIYNKTRGAPIIRRVGEDDTTLGSLTYGSTSK